MTTKPPAERRKFSGARDEIDYLYHKLLYWLYEREDRVRALAFGERLASLLAKACPGEGAILPEECRSLICEAKEDLRGAIKHRENEIRLIRRLHEISRDAPHEVLMLENYGYDDLSDRLDLLATLYHDSGQLAKALKVLDESRRLCAKHGIPFDGEDIMRECLAERQSQRGGRRMKSPSVNGNQEGRSGKATLQKAARRA